MDEDLAVLEHVIKAYEDRYGGPFKEARTALNRISTANALKVRKAAEALFQKPSVFIGGPMPLMASVDKRALDTLREVLLNH